MMKITIIPEKCIACGICALEAPETFDYHDDGIVKFTTSSKLIQYIPDTSSTESAVRKCPTGAITLDKHILP